jgi:hypothetical protein
MAVELAVMMAVIVVSAALVEEVKMKVWIRKMERPQVQDMTV